MNSSYKGWTNQPTSSKLISSASMETLFKNRQIPAPIMLTMQRVPINAMVNRTGQLFRHSSIGSSRFRRSFDFHSFCKKDYYHMFTNLQTATPIYYELSQHTRSSIDTIYGKQLLVRLFVLLLTVKLSSPCCNAAYRAHSVECFQPITAIFTVNCSCNRVRRRDNYNCCCFLSGK